MTMLFRSKMEVKVIYSIPMPWCILTQFRHIWSCRTQHLLNIYKNKLSCFLFSFQQGFPPGSAPSPMPPGSIGMGFPSQPHMMPHSGGGVPPMFTTPQMGGPPMMSGGPPMPGGIPHHGMPPSMPPMPFQPIPNVMNPPLPMGAMPAMPPMMPMGGGMVPPGVPMVPMSHDMDGESEPKEKKKKKKKGRDRDYYNGKEEEAPPVNDTPKKKKKRKVLSIWLFGVCLVIN